MNPFSLDNVLYKYISIKSVTVTFLHEEANRWYQEQKLNPF